MPIPRETLNASKLVDCITTFLALADMFGAEALKQAIAELETNWLVGYFDYEKPVMEAAITLLKRQLAENT